MSRLINDVQENVRRFNQEEVVWQGFVTRRAMRKRLLRLLCSLGSSPALAKKQLDQLDWIAAERETRRSDCIGKWINS
jgi:hypothetical protein